jgi:hypothetical protein
MPLRAFNRDNLTGNGSPPYYDVGDAPLAVVATSLYGVDFVRPENGRVLLPWIALPTSGLDGPEMYQLARTLLYSAPGLPRSFDWVGLSNAALRSRQELHRRELQLDQTFTDYMPQGYALMTSEPEFVGVLAYDDLGFGMGVFNIQGVIRYALTAEMRGQPVGLHIPAERVGVAVINPIGLRNTSLVSQPPLEPTEEPAPSLWDRLEADDS